ncbi:MAG: ASKHA domain-containing protein [Nitrospirota bacterium]
MESEAKLKVNILPDEKEVICSKGATILKACASAGIMLNAPCNGEGTCGKCVIQIIEGVSAPDSCEHQLLSGTMLKIGYRFACRSRVTDNMRLIIPAESRILKIKSVKASRIRELHLRPNITKIFLKVQQPKERHGIADLDIVEGSIKRRFGKVETSLGLIRRLPDLLKEGSHRITAVIIGRRLTDLEIGDTTKDVYGISFDIGTTIIAGCLVNLNNGKELSSASDLNFQSEYGKDLKTRITSILRNPEDGLKELQDALIARINGIITELVAKKRIGRESIYEMAAAGNSVMQHIFLGINPLSLVSATHHPVIKRGIDADASMLGININKMAKVYVMPAISGFVGGDAIALILSTAMNIDNNIKLAVSMGANGIIILGSKDRILVYSTSASSAFDGVHINHGMPASEGAISDVIFSHKHKKIKDIELKVINNTEPEGITGGALAALISELRRFGIIEKTGRIKSREELKNSLDDAILNRISSDKDGNTFIIYSEKRRKIILTQKDVKEFQLAKAAIRAAIEIMKKILKITDDEISEVYLSGAYGNVFVPEKTVEAGIFPEDYSDRIEYIGDTSYIGAKMALLSKDVRAEAEIISNSVEYLDLSNREDFQDEFSNWLNFI